MASLHQPQENRESRSVFLGTEGCLVQSIHLVGFFLSKITSFITFCRMLFLINIQLPVIDRDEDFCHTCTNQHKIMM